MTWLFVLIAALGVYNAIRIRLLERKLHMLTDPTPILAQLTDISTKVDTLIASQAPAIDLQPLADAAAVIDAKLTAAAIQPPAPPAPAP